MGYRPGPRTSTGPMSQYPAVRGLPEMQKMYSNHSRRMRAEMPDSSIPDSRVPATPAPMMGIPYEGTRGNVSPAPSRGVQGGSFQPLPPPVNDRGCPVGWSGEGDNVSFRSLLSGGGSYGAGVATQVIVSAPYEFEVRYLILQAFLNTADPGATPALGGAVPAGSVFLQSARTANGPDALFSSNGAPGIDVNNFDPTNFVPRDGNYPSFYNQPGLTLNFLNENTQSVILIGTFWGVSAHAGAPNLGDITY